MEVLEGILSRRSCRVFDGAPVDEAILEKIIDAGRHAPSAMNKQPWHFTVITGRRMLDALDELVLGSPKGSFFYKAPALIIVSRDPGAMYGVEDASCALENMLLAAHGLGLGAVWCNKLNGNTVLGDKLRAFGIPGDMVPHGCLALGHPVPGFSASPRILAANKVTWIS